MTAKVGNTSQIEKKHEARRMYVLVLVRSFALDWQSRRQTLPIKYLMRWESGKSLEGKKRKDIHSSRYALWGSLLHCVEWRAKEFLILELYFNSFLIERIFLEWVRRHSQSPKSILTTFIPKWTFPLFQGFLQSLYTCWVFAFSTQEISLKWECSKEKYIPAASSR